MKIRIRNCNEKDFKNFLINFCDEYSFDILTCHLYIYIKNKKPNKNRGKKFILLGYNDNYVTKIKVDCKTKEYSLITGFKYKATSLRDDVLGDDFSIPDMYIIEANSRQEFHFESPNIDFIYSFLKQLGKDYKIVFDNFVLYGYFGYDKTVCEIPELEEDRLEFDTEDETQKRYFRKRRKRNPPR